MAPHPWATPNGDLREICYCTASGGPAIAAVSAEQIARIAQCEECLEVWLPGYAGRWHAYWIDEGPDERLAFWCPECTEREFGGG